MERLLEKIPLNVDILDLRAPHTISVWTTDCKPDLYLHTVVMSAVYYESWIGLSQTLEKLGRGRIHCLKHVLVISAV